VATGELRSILDRLIPIEARHLAFWQDFFDLHVERLADSLHRHECGAAR
jgi:hypothetical protein